MKKLLVFSLVFALGAGFVLPQFSYALTPAISAEGEMTINADVKPNVIINGNDFEITTNVKPKPAVETGFTLLGPNGGDIWRAGEKHTLKWEAYNYPKDASHKIFAYNQTTGRSFEVKVVSGTKGKFIWTVPRDITSGIYRLKGPNHAEIQIYMFNSPSLLGNPDVNGDRKVNVNDLLAVLNAWGQCDAPSPVQSVRCPDISGPAGRPDGTVNQYDLDTVIDNWTGENSAESTITGSGGVSIGGGSPNERPTSVKPVLERPTLRPQTSYTKPLLLRPQILPVRPQGTVPPVTERPQVQPADRPEIVSQSDRPQTERPQADRPTITTNVSTEVRINADVTGDGRVNVNDLLAVLNAWGKCKSASCRADINNDHVVNGTDLALVLRNWSR